MKKVKSFGNILFWLTLLSPIISFALACVIGEVSVFGIMGIIRYSWIMWIFVPIGVLSFLIGLKLKKSKNNYKKNVIVACICLPLIIILGSYRFIFNSVSYETDKVNTIENVIKIELPEQIKIATNNVNSYNVSYLKIINEESKVKFERELEINQLWQNNLSSKIKSLLPFDIQYETETFDYFVFYNVARNEYNVYPTDGEYEFIFIAYDYELQRLIILDNYKIELN